METRALPPGNHGATIAGTHGIGVSTPQAAAVAEATDGLDRVLHIPKGMIFTMGLLSIMLPTGLFCTIGRSGSTTMKGDGAIPKLHLSIAPAQTNFPIGYSDLGASWALSFALKLAVAGGGGTGMPSLMFWDLKEVLAST